MIQLTQLKQAFSSCRLTWIKRQHTRQHPRIIGTMPEQERHNIAVLCFAECRITSKRKKKQKSVRALHIVAIDGTRVEQ